jgi:hypothetical protein
MKGNMREATKDITLDGQKYQIGRVPASTGLWIIRNLQNSDEGVFTKIQRYLFKSLKRYNPQGIAEPVMMEDGRWIAKDLEDDTVLVANLFGEVLSFNIDDARDFSSGEVKAGQSPSPNPPTK